MALTGGRAEHLYCPTPDISKPMVFVSTRTGRRHVAKSEMVGFGLLSDASLLISFGTRVNSVAIYTSTYDGAIAPSQYTRRN
jgi:hypothetical protein